MRPLHKVKPAEDRGLDKISISETSANNFTNITTSTAPSELEPITTSHFLYFMHMIFPDGLALNITVLITEVLKSIMVNSD